MEHSKSSYERTVYSYIGPPQEVGKIPNEPFKFIPKETRKRKTKPNISRKKEVIKIRVEMNKIEKT